MLMPGQCGNWGIKEYQANDMVTDSTEMAEILSKQFESVFTAEDTSSIPDTGTSQYPPIPDIDITLNGVRNLLSVKIQHE